VKLVNKQTEMSTEAFNTLAKSFNKVEIDLGCGDGRLVYKHALINPSTLYVGIDPAPKQTDEYAKKATRKKLNNLLYVVGSFELFPAELVGSADKLNIILPWGSLLQAVAKPSTETVKKLTSILKPNGNLEIIFGYDSELEPNQTDRLNLGEINENSIKTEILPVFEKGGFALNELSLMTTNELKQVESTWGKRISQRTERTIYHLLFSLKTR